MQKYNFKLTQDEANQIVQALAKRPFEEVSGLIGNLQNQFSEQVSEEKPQEEILEESKN